MKNTQRRNLRISRLVAFIGAFMTVAPWLFDIDMFEGGGALVMLGLLVALTAWISGSILFKEMAKIMDDAMDESKVLAKWTYDSGTWRKHMEEEKQDMKTANTGMIIMIIVVATIISIPILIASDEKLMVLIIYGVLILFGSLGMYLNIRRIRYISDKPYMIVTRDGAVFNGEVEFWRGKGRDFNGARYDKESNSILIDYYSYFTRGPLERTAVIEIPDGLRIDIDRVVRAINGEV